MKGCVFSSSHEWQGAILGNRIFFNYYLKEFLHPDEFWATPNAKA